MSLLTAGSNEPPGPRQQTNSEAILVLHKNQNELCDLIGRVAERILERMEESEKWGAETDDENFDHDHRFRIEVERSFKAVMAKFDDLTARAARLEDASPADG
jgi:hypothetical protein